MINPTFKTNTLSTSINRHISNSDEKIKATMEKLSSGLRINKASDDASGLSISERLKSQVRGLQQSKDNLNDGLSLVNTADGALGSIADTLQRIRELTIQGKNGTLSPQDKLSIDNEISELLKNIDKVSNTTTFNGINLLNMTPTVVEALGDTWTPSTPVAELSGIKEVTSNGSIFVGVKNNNFVYSTDGLTWNNGTGATPPSSMGNVIWTGNQFVSSGNTGVFTSTNGIDWTQKASTNLSLGIAYNGSTYVGVQFGSPSKIYTSSDLSTWTQQAYAPTSNSIAGVEYKSGFQGGKFTAYSAFPSKHYVSSDGVNWTDLGDFETVWDYDKGNLPSLPKEIIEANGKFYAAVGNDGIYESTDRTNWTKYANVPAGNYSEVEYDSVNNKLIGITTTGSVTISQGIEGDEPLQIHSGSEFDNAYGIELSDVTTTSLGINTLSVTDPTALQKIDSAIQKITDERTKYGIAQNRLEVKLENNSISTINTSKASQRISEADMSSESSTLVKEQIKSQTALTMLERANSFMEQKLTLLQG